MVVRHVRTHTMLRLTAVAMAFAVVGSALSLYAPAPLLASAQAATWTVDTAARTEADIRAQWELLKPTYTGTAYAVAPSIVAPYAPGDATAGFRADGVNMINFARYLAGLPADVTLDAVRNADAQYGAVLLAASNFDHVPVQPADMPLDFYTRARDLSTRVSNIGWGHPDSESFQKSCLGDSDPGNIVWVGHRRWLLNPQMKVTGIGAAASGSSMRHTTYSFDCSRPLADVDYSAVAWPSAGIFPVEFVSATTPWSITLNPATYDWDATRAGHTITLCRISDGRTWTFDDVDSNPSGEYFNADFSYIGSRNVFIFRPNPADLGTGYKAGDQFDVTFSGGIYAEGTRTPVTVTYRTSFGALSGAATAFAAPLTYGTTTPPVQPVPPTPPITPAPGATRAEQTDVAFTYYGTWSTWANAALSGGSYRYSNLPGSGTQVSFDGTRLDIIARTGPEFGEALVTVDGGTPKTVDLYAPQTRYQQAVFTTGELSAGAHSVRIDYAGAKNPASTGTYVSIDAVDVVGAVTRTLSRAEQTDVAFTYYGTWAAWANAALSGGSYRYSNLPGSGTQVSFDGTRLDIIARTGPEFGEALVTVDGGTPTTVDLYAPQTRYQQAVFTTGELSAGAHSVRIDYAGAKNPASTGTYVSIDAVDVVGTITR